MIWVILAILIAIFIICYVIDNKTDSYGEVIFAGSLFIGLPFLICVVFACMLFYDVIAGGWLDEKISLAESQNADIEAKVAIVVGEYLGYESSTYKALKPESGAIMAATMYPELQSNSLVQEQVKVYEENVKKITSLKEQKIDLGVKKWWLYFGGKDE